MVCICTCTCTEDPNVITQYVTYATELVDWYWCRGYVRVELMDTTGLALYAPSAVALELLA